MAKRYIEAIECERKAVQLRPHFGTAWRTMAAAAGLAGDPITASHALSQAQRLQPSLSVQWVEKYHPIVHAADRSMYVDGLRAAGL
jgi:adenylate cyclase